MRAARQPDPSPWRWPPLDDDTASDPQFTPMAPDALCASERSSAGETDDSTRRDVPRSPGDVREEAERLIEQARREAEDIRRRAREETVREVRGRLEEALHETVAEQVAAFEEARQALLAQMRAAAARRADELEREVAGLVAQMAAKVVRRTIEEDASIVLDVVRDTIAEAAGASRLTVHVAPAQEALVREAQAELLSAAEGAEELRIVADEAVGEGGCIAETGRGRFDARIETQLELLEDELAQVLGGVEDWHGAARAAPGGGDCSPVSESS
ncbi:MAG: FliH/SctL family protein [Armatimonadota bacterium]